MTNTVKRIRGIANLDGRPIRGARYRPPLLKMKYGMLLPYDWLLALPGMDGPVGLGVVARHPSGRAVALAAAVEVKEHVL